MSDAIPAAPRTWRDRLPAGFREYTEKAPIAAFFVGVSSGFPYAMIGATLTTRLAQDGIDKKTVTAFTLAFLVYNFKFLWSWIIDGVKIPVLHRLGQRDERQCDKHAGKNQKPQQIDRHTLSQYAVTPCRVRLPRSLPHL